MADVIALRPKLHYGNTNDVNGISVDDNDDRYDPHDAAIGEILHFPKWETREREGQTEGEGIGERKRRKTRRGKNEREGGRSGGAEAASGVSWHAKVLPPARLVRPSASVGRPPVRPPDRFPYRE